MVYLLIVALLVIGGTLLSSKWIAQTQLDRSIISFASAVTLAKATSLKNETAQVDAEITSMICYDDEAHMLTVHKSREGKTADCDTPTVYKYDLSGSIEVLNPNNTTFKCFAFDAMGRLSNNSSKCSSVGSVNVKNGDMQDAYSIN